MSIKNLSLKDAREKMGVKQDELGKVFAEALTDAGHDFSKVKCLGDNLTARDVGDKVKAMNVELIELGEHIETLDGAEKAAKEHADREKGIRTFQLPGGKGNHQSQYERVKSIGEMVLETKSFQEWQKGGSMEGVSLKFDEMMLSDFLASASRANTIGAKALMSNAAGFAPEHPRLPGFVDAVTRPIQLLDIIPLAQVGTDQVTYMEETTRTHAAAETAEGGTYAESTFAFTEKSSPVRKITDSLPVTDEQLDDVALIQSYINGRLTYGIRQRLDGQCLIGNGTAPNLRGIKNVVGIQTQAKGADPVPDAFFKAMTKLRVTGRVIPTHHVMHPTDWQGVRLLRTVDGMYIWGNPSEAGPERLWGLPVVQQDADAAGTGYVGAFDPAWISLFERKGVDIQVGYTGTQFTEGKRTVRGDTRVALVVTRPAAFCSVTGL